FWRGFDKQPYPGRIPYWYKDIQQTTTIPDSNNRLLDDFITVPTNDSSFYELEPCLSSPPTTKNWIVTLDDLGSPIFGKQLLVQAGRDGIRLYYSKLNFVSDPSPTDATAASAIPTTVESSAAAVFVNSPLVVSAESRYIFYTNRSLINLGTPDVSMGWSWMQIVLDAGFPNSIATYAHSIIWDNPSFSRAEAAAIYAVLTISSHDSEVTIYTDSQTAIDGLRVKAHSGNYLNDFADSLANTAHTASSSILISGMDLASAHDFVLTYDNDVVCESNPRHLLKQYYQTQLMHYIVDWDLTWFTLKFEPSHNASFTFKHASRHRSFKFKLFLDDLPTLEKLKRTRPDLYIDELSCCSCYLISKLQEAGKLADIDPTPFITKLTSLLCWSFSSTNWSSYALVRGCLSRLFIDLFVDLSIPRNSAIKVVAAIHNNFIQKFRRRI
ncbi:hypothetical protein RhiirB3_438325, partial [Rhizophagus irregularis]